MPLDSQDRLRLDYERTFDHYKWLADVRFKLLALVPSVTVIASAVLGKEPAASTVPVKEPPLNVQLIACFGLVATIGVVFYELRNSQFYDALIHRLKELEKDLAFASYTENGGGGQFTDRPRRRQRFFGMFELWHDRALGLVYGASIGLWVLLILPQKLEGIRVAGAVLAALLVLFEFARLERDRHR